MEAFILPIIVFIYMLPTILAYDKKHFIGISILNFLLGWTIVFWVAALILSIKNEKRPTDEDTNLSKEK